MLKVERAKLMCPRSLLNRVHLNGVRAATWEPLMCNSAVFGQTPKQFMRIFNNPWLGDVTFSVRTYRQSRCFVTAEATVAYQQERWSAGTPFVLGE